MSDLDYREPDSAARILAQEVLAWAKTSNVPAAVVPGLIEGAVSADPLASSSDPAGFAKRLARLAAVLPEVWHVEADGRAIPNSRAVGHHLQAACLAYLDDAVDRVAGSHG